MKRMLWVLMAGAVLASGVAQATLISLDTLMTQKQEIRIGDKVFSDWGFSGEGPLTAAQIDVDAEQVNDNVYNLYFRGPIIAYNGQTLDYTLSYSVATASGKPLIVGIDQWFNLTAQGNTGIIGIGETVLDANQRTVAQSSVGYVFGVTDQEDPAGELIQGDQLVINPGLAKVWVTKDIALKAAPGGMVGATWLRQSFHQANVPDGGATLALLGMAMAGVAVVRRFMRG